MQIKPATMDNLLASSRRLLTHDHQEDVSLGRKTLACHTCPRADHGLGSAEEVFVDKETLATLAEVGDSVRRRAVFMAVFSREMQRRTGSMPIIVGGEALEIYTQGGYSTGDVDIKAPKEEASRVLGEMGFARKGRLFVNAELGLYVDWLGESLEEGPEAEARTNLVEVAEGLSVRVVSFEDLLIDRLLASSSWGDKDSRLWAESLIQVARKGGFALDMEYLRKRAQAEGIERELENLLVGGEDMP